MIQFEKMKAGKVLIKLAVFAGITIMLGLTLAFIPQVRKIFTTSSNPLNRNSSSKITYWGLYMPEQVMDPLVAKYQQENPNIEIEYVEKQFADDIYRYKQTLYGQLSEGTGPDIFRVHSTWMPEFVSQVSRTNKAISVTDYRKRFYPIAYSQCGTTVGELLCVPIMYDGLALFYNKDIFFDEGLTEPTTWQEVKDISKKLTVKSGGKITQAGIALGTVDNVVRSTDILAFMMAQSDVD